MDKPRDPRTPIEMAEHHQLPWVWLVIIGMVVIGFIATFTINLFSSGGLVIWPFIFAVSMLLLLNQMSANNAVGVPPLQAYGLFLGVLIVLFGVIALISRINPWVVMAMTVGAGVYVGLDWRKRKQRDLEITKRRLAGVCVRCLTPVKGEVEEICSNCYYPVNPERLNLLQLGRAIANQGRSDHMRATLGAA